MSQLASWYADRGRHESLTSCRRSALQCSTPPQPPHTHVENASQNHDAPTQYTASLRCPHRITSQTELCQRAAQQRRGRAGHATYKTPQHAASFEACAAAANAPHVSLAVTLLTSTRTWASKRVPALSNTAWRLGRIPEDATTSAVPCCLAAIKAASNWATTACNASADTSRVPRPVSHKPHMCANGQHVLTRTLHDHVSSRVPQHSVPGESQPPNRFMYRPSTSTTVDAGPSSNRHAVTGSSPDTPPRRRHMPGYCAVCTYLSPMLSRLKHASDASSAYLVVHHTVVCMGRPKR